MTADPKLVWVCSCGCGFGVTGIPQSEVRSWECSDGYPLDPTPLRLVQLPEEPSWWEWEASDGIGATLGRVRTRGAAVVQARNVGSNTGRIRPVYIFPGDPQEGAS